MGEIDPLDDLSNGSGPRSSAGMEIRAQMDTEGLKALLLMNSGGAVALLAFCRTFSTSRRCAP
jgi:hypothetical protein